MCLKQNLQRSKILKTDFYTIVPYSDFYIIIIGDVVVGAYTFSSLEEAEEFVFYNYEELARNSGV